MSKIQDPEIHAIAAICRLLEPMSVEAVARVLDYVESRWDDRRAGFQWHTIGGEVRTVVKAGENIEMGDIVTVSHD